MSARLAVAIVLLLAGCSVAHARNEAEARKHYTQGMTKYDLAEYDEAIAEFKRAYELTHEAGLLFNIAQAYRLKKDPALALSFYESFLGLQPDAPNRADAEAQMVKMREAIASAEAERQRRAQAAEEESRRPLPPARTLPPVTPTSPVLAAPPRPSFVSSPRGRAVVATAIVGGAALVVGAALGGAALAERGSYDSTCNAGLCDGARYDSGRRMAIATDVLLSFGAAAAVVSIVVAVVRPRARPLQLGMRF